MCQSSYRFINVKEKENPSFISYSLPKAKTNSFANVEATYKCRKYKRNIDMSADLSSDAV